MPFFGPYNLGGTAPNVATDRLRQQFPGIQSMTSYPGQGGVGTASLGFTHPGPLLFQGQPPSTLDALLASPPRLVEGVNVQPESITGALSGGTTPTLGIARSDSIGGDPSGVGGVSGVGSTGAAPSSGAGMPSGFFADIADAVTMGQANSPIGRGVAAVGVPTGLQGIATAAGTSLANAAIPGAGLANAVIGMLTQTSPTPAMTQGLVQAGNQLVDIVNAPTATEAPSSGVVGSHGTSPAIGLGAVGPSPGPIGGITGLDMSPAPTTAPTEGQIASAMGLSGHLGDTGVGKQFALEQGLNQAVNTNTTNFGAGQNAPSPPGLDDPNVNADSPAPGPSGAGDGGGK